MIPELGARMVIATMTCRFKLTVLALADAPFSDGGRVDTEPNDFAVCLPRPQPSRNDSPARREGGPTTMRARPFPISVRIRESNLSSSFWVLVLRRSLPMAVVHASERSARRESRVWLRWRVDATKWPRQSNSRNELDHFAPSHDRSTLGRYTVGARTLGYQSATLQPRVRHRAFDDVSLNSFAERTSKRAQVLPSVTRFVSGPLHGRAASCALGTLVVGIEHALASLSVRCFKPSCSVRFEKV